jgi:integrase
MQKQYRRGTLLNNLTALKVTRITEPGMYSDGAGLYLQVQGKSRSWIFRYKVDGRGRYMGLGSARDITLRRARELAAEQRRLRAEGRDPLAERQAQRPAPAREVPTFKQVAETYIKTHELSWKSNLHRRQWRVSLAADVFPVLGNMPIDQVDTAAVLRALQPIWHAKPETANRIRGRVESILAAATATGLRAGPNPAQWRNHLDHLLPRPNKLRPPKHYQALPYKDVPAFVAELRARSSISARGLEFVILTATRKGEALAARWDEIDLTERTWTIPASRMKAGREHRVPLSVAALDILRPLDEARSSEHVFTGYGGRLGGTALAGLLRVMGRADITTHGFRSSFRDWAAEQTSYPSEVAEMALAHAVGNQVERAYRRGDLFDKRARLMQAWAEYCAASPASGEVVGIRG